MHSQISVSAPYLSIRTGIPYTEHSTVHLADSNAHCISSYTLLAIVSFALTAHADVFLRQIITNRIIPRFYSFYHSLCSFKV